LINYLFKERIWRYKKKHFKRNFWVLFFKWNYIFNNLYCFNCTD